MKFDQLNYFLETAKQEHIGKAAKALAISPSAISHSIRALEDELGRGLFIKRGKNIFLTAHGKLLFEEGKKLVQEIERVRDEISSDRVELRGHYKMAANHSLCARTLLPAWTQVQNENPKLTLEIYSTRSSLVLQGVVSGEYDFGICFSPQDHPEIDKKILSQGKLLIAVRKGHPILDSSCKKQLALLSTYPAVLPKAFRGVDICERHPMFTKFGIIVKPDCLFDNYDVGVEKIRRSLSWGLLPEEIAKESGLICLKPPKNWEAPYFVVAIWQKNQFLTGVLKEMLQALEVKKS